MKQNPGKKGLAMRSNILEMEMMQASNKPISANQMKRMERMRDNIERDKAATLNIKKLKEATLEVRSNIDDGKVKNYNA